MRLMERSRVAQLQALAAQLQAALSKAGYPDADAGCGCRADFASLTWHACATQTVSGAASTELLACSFRAGTGRASRLQAHGAAAQRQRSRLGPRRRWTRRPTAAAWQPLLRCHRAPSRRRCSSLLCRACLSRWCRPRRRARRPRRRRRGCAASPRDAAAAARAAAAYVMDLMLAAAWACPAPNQALP